MNVISLKKALFAGVAGTVVMTVFSYVSKYLNFPRTDLHGMISSHFHTGGLFTWLIYFGCGVVLAYLYGHFVMKKLPSHGWVRGMIYALMLWGVMELVMMPILGMGFLSGSIMGAAFAYVTMAFYGGTVGYLYEH